MNNILNIRLLKFNEQLTIDMKLSEINIKDKTLMCPGMKVKWLRILFEEKKILSKFIESKTLKIGEYVSKHGQVNIPKIKTIDEAKHTEDILKIEKIISEQKEVVEYLEQANKIMMNMNYDLKNAIDIIKMENI